MGEHYMLPRLARVAVTTYPLRTCRTLHFCEVCEKNITIGQRYYDGGYRRRLHEGCANQSETAAGRNP